MQSSIRYLGFTILALSFLTSVACKKGSSTATDSNASASTPAPSSPSDHNKIKIKTADDQPVAEFKLDGDQVKIEFGTTVLRGDLNKEKKRKYQVEGGTITAEVKPDDDGFKVRTPDGKLLWKVKTTSDKIKISNNEDNSNPFALEIKASDRVKILQNETDLGEVKFYRDRQKVKVKDTSNKEIFQSNTDRYSASYGVLLMQQIPEAERNIIIAELLSRNF